MDTLHFAGALTLSDNLMAPYIGAGIGATRFAAYDSEVAPPCRWRSGCSRA